MGKEPHRGRAAQPLPGPAAVGAAAEEIPEPADEKPSYQRDDIARRLESSEEFRLLTAEVEKKLGKRLTTPDVGVLLGLNDYLGLPADVIFLLVNHCVERVTGSTERGVGPPCGRSRRRATPGPDGASTPRGPQWST